MIGWRRVRAYAGLFASLAATAAVIAALGVGVPGYLTAVTTVETRTGLSALTGSDAGYRIGTQLASDPTAQDAGIRRLITRAAGGAPVVITRTLGTESPVPIRVGGRRHDGSLLTDPGLRDASRLTAGTWPRGADEVAVQAEAARVLGLRAGSELTLGDDHTVTVRVTGLWRARDSEAPRWLGDSVIRTGSGDTGRGPILVDASVWSAIHMNPDGQWTTLPVIDRFAPADLAGLGGFESRLADELQTSPLGQRGTDDEGNISAAARDISSRVTAVLGTAPVAAIVLAALAALALVELGRLLIASREAETLLLRARGASVRRIGWSTALETGAAALLGAVVAAAAVTAAVDLASPITLPLALSIGVALGTSLATAAVLGVASARRARVALTRERATESGRTRRLGSTGLIVVAVGAAVLSCIQFLRDGGPIVRDITGSALIDPLSAPAPALAVVAVALLALVLAPPLAALLGARTARRPGLVALETRRLRRGLPSVAAAIVLVSLTCALLVVAAADSATLVNTAITQRERSLGADIVAYDATGDQLHDAAARVHAPSASVVVRSIGIGPQPVTAVGISHSSLATVATDVGGALDLPSLARQIAVTRPGVPIPTGRTLEASVIAAPLAPTTIAARVLTADDRLLDLTAPVTSGTVSIALPAGSGMRLLALDVTIPPDPLATDEAVRKTHFLIDDLRTETGALDTGGDWVSPYILPDTDFHVPDGHIGQELPAVGDQPTLVRVMPRPAGPVPVVVARAAASAAGLHVGTDSTITEDSGATPIVVQSVAPQLPAGADVLVDLAEFHDAELRLTDPPDDDGLWMAGTPADGARLESGLPATASVSLVQDPRTLAVAGSAGTALVIAAGGALLIAAIAVTAVVGADVRSRRDDVAILRALGVAPRAQGRSRGTELALVLGWGAVAGLVGGLGISALLIPDLAASALSAGGGAATAGLRIDPVVLGIGLGLLVLALAALLALTALRIRGAARSIVLADGAS